jgi:uncharacterized protein YdeI (YjbR/CyaY-like superfamily)
MARAAEDAPILTVRCRADLRNWLEQNHTGPGPVWLATYKKHHPSYMSYEPQAEELLCWRWIDSVTRALDADRSMILIAPRRVTSAWSAINKAHVDRARASGAMTPAGEARVAAAVANGQWSFLDDVEGLEIPAEAAGVAVAVRQDPLGALTIGIRAAGLIVAGGFRRDWREQDGHPDSSFLPILSAPLL